MAAATNTVTGTNNTTLPGYVAPYVDDLFARSQALTTGTPYQSYAGPRVAEQNGLQTGAADSVSGLDAGNAISQGQQLIGQGANYTPNTQSFGLEAAAQYMNPYQQSVTDIAKREAARDSGIQQVANDSKAAQAGAFGGSRQGVVDAELQRNLGTRLNDIQTQGLNSAYTNAQTQFNADQNRQQQDAQFGSQAAIKGGEALDASGAKTFGLQSTAGLLQQQTEQAQNDVGYQDFLKQQQHPYDQLTFQRNMISGFPGSSSTSTSTSASTPASNWLSDAAGLATAGASIWDSIGGWFKEGGSVKSGLGHGRVAQLYGSLK